MIDFEEISESAIAEELDRCLREKVMPYWHDTAVDLANGGYILSDRLSPSRNRPNRLHAWISAALCRNGRRTGEKQLVSQSRLLLVFSMAHRLGYSNGNRDYLKAAEAGYRFLLGALLDKHYGGFFWKTDLRGRVINPCKSLYGQAFVLYALLEYYRASGLSAPLDQAFFLFEKVQEKFHDGIHPGWREHGEEDFSPLKSSGQGMLWYPKGLPGVLGVKSGNAHLHWMEALTEFYEVTRDASVKSALTEALHINKTFFFPKEASAFCEYRLDDWGEVKGEGFEEICYGHNVEFAWLMIRAQEVLESPPDWDHSFSILTHALTYGFDYKRGGFYFKGFGEQPASNTEKVWWVQAECLAGLTDALRYKRTADYRRVLDLLLNWIFRYQIPSDDGIWIASTDCEGRPLNPTKADEWKAAYHEVRAMTKFIQTFSSPGGADGVKEGDCT
ncbi:MAG TPA: AGE family epimerase/isomerase [Thermodesulfovibrionales bacterium]|nr:AGE family epimerase/isomerase [Thermodesulfovibrionales bacterium]